MRNASSPRLERGLPSPARGRISPALGLALALSAALASACAPGPESNYDPEKAISIAPGGLIVVSAGSPFQKHLEVAALASGRGQGSQFKVVGQIVALANSSDQLTGVNLVWSELDPDLSKSLGLNLNVANARVGEAYGLAELPSTYGREVKRGDTLSISRYGLRNYLTTAKVWSVRPAPEDREWLRVVFLVEPGEEWYPGNNCEVAFPSLRSAPKSVPTTALLHEGAEEYLLQETAPASYKPRRIVILETLGSTALVVGDLGNTTRIVTRGAILLKPYLHQLLRARAAEAAKGDAQ